MGCFVTIRRKGRLRGCCGLVGRATTLADAITEAAVSTATRDVRLPTISPTELPLLDVGISLLHSLKPIRAHGADRIAQVNVGQHGLQIVRGGARRIALAQCRRRIRSGCRALPATGLPEGGTAGPHVARCRHPIDHL